MARELLSEVSGAAPPRVPALSPVETVDEAGESGGAPARGVLSSCAPDADEAPPAAATSGVPEPRRSAVTAAAMDEEAPTMGEGGAEAGAGAALGSEKMRLVGDGDRSTPLAGPGPCAFEDARTRAGEPDMTGPLETS